MIEEETRRNAKSSFVRRVVFILLGAGLISAGLEVFLVPNNIIDGGITGISIMLAHASNLSIGVFLCVLNLPFLWIGYRQIGKTFTLSTLLGVVAMSIGTTLLVPVKPVTLDPLLAAVFGGIVVGLGVGLVIRSGGSTDGTEIISILFSKRMPFSVGEIVMFFNVFILGSAGFMFGWDHAMYSLIAYFIAYKMIDIAIEGLDQSKSVWIITPMYEEIADAIIHRLGRGVTLLHGEGGFAGDSKKVIFVVITRLEEAKLKSIVADCDKQAFVAIGNIHDITGGRFKKNNIH